MHKGLWAFLRKEFLMEWREKYALNGILLYLITTIFVCYLGFQTNKGSLHPLVWNVLFWIILLFTSVNAVAKSFLQEREERLRYYYVLMRPQTLILSKIAYQVLLLSGIALVGFLFYGFVMGNPVADVPLYLLAIVLGATGFAAALTMVSGIAVQAKNSTTLVAILGFPILLPMLLMLIKVSRNALDGLARSVSTDEILTLLALDAIIVAVSYLLFPYLWRG
ncbi:MAG: heme exporter protein CcmB [Bernardetiaceae bacterium]